MLQGATEPCQGRTRIDQRREAARPPGIHQDPRSQTPSRAGYERVAAESVRIGLFNPALSDRLTSPSRFHERAQRDIFPIDFVLTRTIIIEPEGWASRATGQRDKATTEAIHLPRTVALLVIVEKSFSTALRCGSGSRRASRQRVSK
jgi:hypothetical protein